MPANSCVRSCSYNQSRVRPKQSSLSISAITPAPSRCSTGLLAKNCGTRYNCRRLSPKPLSTMATVAVPTLTRLSPLWFLSIQPPCQSDLLAHACDDPQMVQPFIDVFLGCLHPESSSAVDSTLAIFPESVNQTAECGLMISKSPYLRIWVRSFTRTVAPS